MLERDDSIGCQQNSKKPEKINNKTIIIIRQSNLPGNKEADKNNRQQYQENKILQLEQEQQQRKILDT